jgi:hypothetical protein
MEIYGKSGYTMDDYELFTEYAREEGFKESFEESFKEGIKIGRREKKKQ